MMPDSRYSRCGTPSPTPRECGTTDPGSDYYDINLDHNYDGNLDGEDVNAYIANVSNGGPKSAADLLKLQAAGCEIDAQDLKDFVKNGGKLTGDDVTSFVANGGTLTQEDYQFLKDNGVRFDPKQTLLMESRLGIDLNRDGKTAGSHVADTYLGQYATPLPDNPLGHYPTPGPEAAYCTRG